MVKGLDSLRSYEVRTEQGQQSRQQLLPTGETAQGAPDHMDLDDVDLDKDPEVAEHPDAPLRRSGRDKKEPIWRKGTYGLKDSRTLVNVITLLLQTLGYPL